MVSAVAVGAGGGVGVGETAAGVDVGAAVAVVGAAVLLVVGGANGAMVCPVGADGTEWDDTMTTAPTTASKTTASPVAARMTAPFRRNGLRALSSPGRLSCGAGYRDSGAPGTRSGSTEVGMGLIVSAPSAA
jgi:hypothetical protein